MSAISLRLPDGKALELEAGSTLLDAAAAIGPGLAKAALAGRFDGELVDLRMPLERDGPIEIITAKSPEGGEIIRHTAEHVLADAVKRLFPQAQVDVGRSDHSEKFQYDFLVAEPFTPDDIDRIEKEMKSIISDAVAITREVMSREEAIACFSELGEELKVSRIEDIPKGSEITVFGQGSFRDLCRGPHVQNTGQIGAFQLTEVSGSYWRGDETGPKLQRVYGVAFASKKELKAHLHALEEAKKRDHRRVGADLELFHLDPVAPGSPFYLPKGMQLFNGLVDLVRSLYPEYGYQEVLTPQLCRSDLYKTSGHYDMFKDEMFFMEGADEGEELGVKATNCPAHCLMYATKKRSYRELPLRFAEFSRLHRNERSGTMSGLARVRAMSQDDAHIFCEPDDVGAEIDAFFEMMARIYDTLELTGVDLAVSTRPDEFLGDPADWNVAEQQLIEGAERAGFKPRIKPKDAAFYAPKVEADFSDVLGRAWTLGTIQIDMAMPSRFGLEYVGRDGEMHQPAMLHRAVLGSLERFMAIYIEHTGGDFPFWLAPTQAVVLPITRDHVAYATEVHGKLVAAGVRAVLDDRSEKLGFKVREAETGKIPLMLVTGDQEMENGTVAPRLRKSAQEKKPGLEALVVDALVTRLAEGNAKRLPRPLD